MEAVDHFFNPHVHTDFSPDSNSKALLLAQYAREMGQCALAITDHGTVSGWIAFAQACEAFGLKAAFGWEAYHQLTFEPGAPRHHLTILARNQRGVHNIIEMCSYASAKQFYGKPIVTQADLEGRWKEGLIVLSGCRSAYVPHLILEGDFTRALSYIREMRRLYGDYYFLEVQPHGDEAQRIINETLIDYGRSLRIPVVMTTDAHYVRPEEFGLYKVGTHVRKKNDDQRIEDIYKGRHLHSTQSAVAAWQALMGTNDGHLYTQATQLVADACEPVELRGAGVVPRLAEDAEKQLECRAWDGLYQRLQEAGRLLNGRIPAAYGEQLKNELDVFAKRGFSGYILTCGDILEYARTHGILGYPRGSGAGSLVLYALGGLVDPLVWGTSFDRFFSLERPEPPDVDFDIEDRRRDEIFGFLERKYPGRARRIINYGRMEMRSVVKQLALHFGMNSVEKEQMVAALADFGKVDIDERLVREHYVLAELEEKYPGLLDAYFHFIHSVSYYSQHAAGIFITEEPIDSVVPAIWQASSKSLLTAWDMHDLEWLQRGVKYDILGLAGYTQMSECLRIAGLSGFHEEWLYDKAVYKELAAGKSEGIFQLGARHVVQMLRDARVSCFEDVCAIVACDRPGPMDEGGSWEAFLHGGDNNKWLDPFTTETRHALMYQEQIRDFCAWLGLTTGQISKILKMLKKYKDEDQEIRALFVAACRAKAIPLAEAERLWHTIRRYLFNKAHTVTYAMLAVYQTYLRMHYPHAWYYATLVTVADDKIKRPRMEAAAVQHGLPILPAHVNGEVAYSQVWEEDGTHFVVRRGLSVLPNIGNGVAQAIVAERMLHGEYTSKENFLLRFAEHRQLMNSARVKVLLDEGALEFDAERLDQLELAEIERLAGAASYGWV